MKAFAIDRKPGHAGLVAEDRAAGAVGGRIDGEHGDAVARRRQIAAELVDEGGFADARQPGDADTLRAAGPAMQPVQQFIRQPPVIGPAGSPPA